MKPAPYEGEGDGAPPGAAIFVVRRRVVTPALALRRSIVAVFRSGPALFVKPALNMRAPLRQRAPRAGA